MSTCYVLGTSPDLNKLSREWFQDKYTIGINSSFKAANRYGVQLDEWISHDQYFIFHNWLLSNEHPKTRKWVLYDYCVDDRLKIFRPSHKDYKDWEAHRVRFYQARRHNQPSLCPSITDDPKKLSVLDDFIYTIFTAISLAVGLGHTDIRLRGVSLTGQHFDETYNTNLDGLYYDQMLVFRKHFIPKLINTGVTLKNETEDAQFDILEPI